MPDNAPRLEMQDDVPEAVKLARLQEVISTYRAELANSMAAEIGRTHLVSLHSRKLCNYSLAHALCSNQWAAAAVVLTGSKHAVCSSWTLRLISEDHVCCRCW